MIRPNSKLIAFCAGLALAPACAGAQDWNYAASIYGWLPGLGGSVDTAYGKVDLESSGGDILDNLKGAFMGTFEARNDRWGFVLDGVYANLGKKEDAPAGTAFDTVEVNTKVTAVSGYALYRAYDAPNADFDVGIGFRSFGVELETDFNASGSSGSQSNKADSNWTVPLVVARLRVPFGNDWYGRVVADVGGLSSDTSTWQALASVGYQFNESWSAEVGYRYMDIQKKIGGSQADLGLGGFLIGGTYRF
ncbi:MULTISPECIES: outer membrane protein [unclassified Meridianimarinicoccus]|uniref:outer membrane protein n=1 Tax=unclassified Meridianimarinicoccus TaxID=2923344 RepID=UPI00186637BB|nr:hypothetical protein [Fluviibacterium sp. MJW13]